MTRGVILFAHGARDPRWAEPFEEVARRIRARAPGTEVRLAFLELMSPALPEAGRELAEAGCLQIDVLPLFLGAGGHVRKDLPVLMAALAAAHPAVRWQLRNAVGESDAVIEAMAMVALAHAQTPG
jgi:sirohydrochlorin cobaltochelatase